MNLYLQVSLLHSDPAPRAMEGDIFVTASHQTGLDTRSVTQRSIKVGIWREEGQAWADVARPPKGSPAKARGLMASSLSLLDCACTSRWAMQGEKGLKKARIYAKKGKLSHWFLWNACDVNSVVCVDFWFLMVTAFWCIYNHLLYFLFLRKWKK